MGASPACGTKMVKDDIMTISSVTFTRGAVAGIALRQGGYVYLLAVISYGLVVVLMLLGKYPKHILFFFINKKEERELIIGASKGRTVY